MGFYQVQDNGIGIEEDIRGVRTFYRVDKARSSERGGTDSGSRSQRNVEYQGEIVSKASWNAETSGTITLRKLPLPDRRRGSS
jgi:signal transduction histidine kinase